ncbi:hypothetical protein YC2023_119536 [Brassica napus]
MAYFRLNTAEKETGDDLFTCKRCGLVGGFQSFWRIVVRRWERAAVGLGKKEPLLERFASSASRISAAFLALSPAVSPELPVAEAATDFPFGFTDAEETTVFSLILRSVEIEDPFGFTDAEETTVFSLFLRSVEIEDLPKNGEEGGKDPLNDFSIVLITGVNGDITRQNGFGEKRDGRDGCRKAREDRRKRWKSKGE